MNPHDYEEKNRKKLVRDQLIHDRNLMANQSSKRKNNYTFGSLIPNINDSERAKAVKTNLNVNVKVTDLLESIRSKGSKMRMEFIARRMGALRGEEPEAEANGLIDVLRGSVKSNKIVNETKSDTSSVVSHLSNMLELPGRTSLKSIKQGEIESRRLVGALRLGHKLEDNEMLKLINVDEKCINYIMTKKAEGKKLTTAAPMNLVSEKEVTFMIFGDKHSAVRNFLLSKGWIEKYSTPEEFSYIRRLLQNQTRGQIEEPVRFIWLNGWLNMSNLSHRVILSRIPNNCPFSKTNLALGIRNTLSFVYERGEINVRVPRTYEVRGEGDMKNFQKHFRITACIGVLKKVASSQSNTLIISDGKVPLDCVDFAVKRSVELLQLFQHDDLDDWNFSVVKESEWENFLLRFYEIAHYDAKFQKNEMYDTNKLVGACKKLLENIYRVFPEMKYEGFKNLWICKPAMGSCGRGVKVFRKLPDIERYCKPENSYVIQKYIEMPLLVYNTKFDIRQWFIINSVTPLSVWMYDECYLRFCSQEFCLTNLHESVHLCNNTIQWKYKNGVRSSKLPNDNMWDNYQFSEFLKKELKQDQWPHIQDQMRQALVAACIASQDRMYHRSNSFQLFGADFMLTPDFKVWLIEINSSPAMKYSTSVTARMCKAVLEDAIKLGVLKKYDPSAKVGKFREVYCQNLDPTRTSLPSVGIVHAKKSTLVQCPNNYKLSGNSSSAKVYKLLYENIATYKNHPKVQVRQRINSDRPLYPGDVVQTTIENVILVDNVKHNENPSEEANKKMNNAEINEKDGEKLTEKLDYGSSKKGSESVTQMNNFARKINKLSRKELQKRVKNNVKSSPQSSSVLVILDNGGHKSIAGKSIETRKRILSNINIFPKMVKNDLSYVNSDGLDSLGTSSILSLLVNESGSDYWLFNSENMLSAQNASDNDFVDNSFELVNPVEKKASVSSWKMLDENQLDEIPPETIDIQKAISQSSMDYSIDDLYTHGIITGTDLMPELSGYVFIGESGEDRKLEYLLNSSQFLSSIGKKDEVTRPIFQSYVEE